jgi:hypothetical protein
MTTATIETIQFTARRLVAGKNLSDSPIMLRGTLAELAQWCSDHGTEICDSVTSLYGRIEFPGTTWELWPDETTGIEA